MKRIIILLVLCIILGLSGAETSLAEETKNETNTTTEKNNAAENQNFPLDGVESTFSIYDYDYKTLSGQDMKEASIEKSLTTEEEEAAFSRSLELSSDTVDFYPETSQYIAKKNAKLLVREERLQLTANEIIVDQRNYEIIGIGNVKIVKNGIEYYGDYIRINTKKESSFFSNPILYYAEIVVNAKSATMYGEETVAKEGSAVLRKKGSTIFSTSRFGGVLSEHFFDPTMAFDTEASNYKVVAKKMIVKRQHDRTDVIMKRASIYKGNLKVGYSPNLVLATDKDVNYVETSVPEMGRREKIGTFIAPSFVAPLPNASTLKFGPLVSLDTHADIGIGGFARLNTPKSSTDFMYASNTSKFLLNGNYNFTKDLRLQYAINDYMESLWMGSQMPEYGVELVHKKDYEVPQANFKYRNFLSFGLFRDDTKHTDDPLTTLRYRWQGDGWNLKPLLAWEEYLMLGYAYQHDFSLYQTGETAGALRAGPRIYSNLGRFSYDLTYFMAGQLNESPYYFDRYRYGKNNVRFRGQFYINKYLSLAYIGSVNISGRDYEDNWLTENQLIVAAGTEDMKLRFGWDTVRNTALVGMDMFLGTNKAMLEFDEMHVEKFEPAKSKNKNKRKKVKL